VSCLIVQHDSGVVVNYGEVDPASLKKYGMKSACGCSPGSRSPKWGGWCRTRCCTSRRIRRDQAEHLAAAIAGKLTPARIFNPSQYLLALANKGK